MKLVLVEWVDSGFANIWQSRDEGLDIVKCVSVGILVRETMETVELCLSLSDIQKAGGIAIPKCSIKRMRILGVRG